MKHPLLISAHMDSEVGAPWDSQLDQLLKERPSWQAEAELHRAVKERLAGAAEPEIAASQARVWSRLQVSLPQSSPSPTSVTKGLSRWWSAPAVAAALLVMLATGYWWGTTSSSSPAMAELEVRVPTEYDLKVSGDGLLVPAAFEGGRP